jgi:hypothetical protein
VAENLLKLTRYIGKKKKPLAHGSTAKDNTKTKTSTLRAAGNRRKNMSILHHNLGLAENAGRPKPSRRLEHNAPRNNNMEQTPGKQLLYENSEHSLNEGQEAGRPGDDLYEESKMVSLGTLPAERGVSQSAITKNTRKVLQPAIQQSSTTSATIAPPVNNSLASSKKLGMKN